MGQATQRTKGRRQHAFPQNRSMVHAGLSTKLVAKLKRVNRVRGRKGERPPAGFWQMGNRIREAAGTGHSDTGFWNASGGGHLQGSAGYKAIVTVCEEHAESLGLSRGSDVGVTLWELVPEMRRR